MKTRAEGGGADKIAPQDIVHDGGLDLHAGESPGERGDPEIVNPHGRGAHQDDFVL